MQGCGRRSNNTDGEETVRKWKESKRLFVLVVPTHKLLQRHLGFLLQQADFSEV